MRSALILLLILMLPAPLRAQHIFIEAESCTDQNWGQIGDFPGIVSGDKILRLWAGTDPPAGGYYARFAFDVARAGRQCIWAGISLPGMTSPFWSRVDEAPWRHFTEDDVAAQEDLPAHYGVSGCMGWVRLYAGTLAAVEATLARATPVARPFVLS